jgi:hypothetical protein
MDKVSYSLEEIARVVHEANRAMQYNLNDPCPSQPWDVESDFLRENTINGVRIVRMGYSNEEMHQEWCDRMKEAGWVWGPLKNAAKKEHPCLVNYRDLPPTQRHKTEIIRAIVITLSIV